MKILLFGTGDYYSRYKKWFGHQEVLALLDNSKQKQHTVIDGLEVLPPEEGINLEYDIIIIMSFYVKQMKQQLRSLGVDDSRIYHFYDLHQLLADNVKERPMQYYLNSRKIVESKEPKILLLSNDLALGGPAIALFHAAKVLQKHGYAVVVASMIDGPLREIIIENNIAVIVDENLQISTMKEREWVNSFSMIVCNTMNFYVFLSERNTRIPIIWWLHDAAFFYEGVNEEVIKKISMDSLKVVSVGSVPAEAIKEFFPDLVCDILLYGVADAGNKSRAAERKEIIQFITIGFLESRKGQDILLHAVRELPDSVRRKSKFYVVGHGDTMFGEKLREESLYMEEIIFTGSVDREKIHELLSGSNVLICPSRQDPMPTVVAEAMMHSIPCIVSDEIGTADYMQEGIEGFIFHNKDVHALAKRIEWCVNNMNKLEIMGKNARRLYEKYFSTVVFENRFMNFIDDILRKH